MPASARPAAGLRDLGRDLVRVREVQAHPQRVIAAQHLRERRRHAHRLHDGLLDADPDELEVLDRAQARQHVLEPVLVERQRIAAGDQAIANRRRARDVVDRGVDVGLAQRALAARADEPGPRAIAAINRAEIGDEQQHAIRIAMHEARRRAVAVLAERVVLLARRLVELRQRRDRRCGASPAPATRDRSGSCSTASRRPAADLGAGRSRRARRASRRSSARAARGCGCGCGFASASRSTRRL